VPSYVTAWPSRDLIRAGRQQIAREWWLARRAGLDIYNCNVFPVPADFEGGLDAMIQPVVEVLYVNQAMGEPLYARPKTSGKAAIWSWRLRS
jgi:hypothetical protein